MVPGIGRRDRMVVLTRATLDAFQDPQSSAWRPEEQVLLRRRGRRS